MTNEAADRLHNILLNMGAKDGVTDALSLVLDEALAAERLATVKALYPWTNHALRCNLSFPEEIVMPGRWVCTCGLGAILDAEATR